MAGQAPIGIAVTYQLQGQPATLLVRPSAFRQILQGLPEGATQKRVSLNTFEFEFQPDNVVAVNGWTLRLRPGLAEGQSVRDCYADILTEIEPRLQDLNLPLTHVCLNQTELDLIWLILPLQFPQPAELAHCREAYAHCLEALSDLRPVLENPLIASLPLDACCCQQRVPELSNPVHSLLPES